MSTSSNVTKLEALEIEKKEIEIEKIKLEKIKISLENKELRKNSFKKINWAAILIPLSLSIIPVIYLLLSGIFDSKYQEYKTNKAVLELDQKTFIKTRDSFRTNISILRDSLNIEKGELRRIHDSLSNLKTSIDLYKKQIGELTSTRALLNDDLESRDKTIAAIISEKQNFEKNISYEISQLNVSFNRLQYYYGIANSDLEKCKEINKGLLDEIKSLKKE